MPHTSHHLIPGQQAYPPQYQAPMISGAQPGYFYGWVNFGEANYVKGFVIGAVLGFLVANPTVQKAVVRGAAKVWYSIMGGVEELKEQVRDVGAEMKTTEE